MKQSCSACHSALELETEKIFQYCPYCGTSLNTTLSDEALVKHKKLIPRKLPVYEAAPKKAKQLFNIDRYLVTQLVGKGGMGEIYLAYDPICGRYVALKRIRDDLAKHQTIYNRFLREARITCHLTHPTIIPIYSIHVADKNLYYTMPYVEGESLKQIFRATRVREVKGEKAHPIGGSLPALIRIFISICQGVAYSHSKGILHRDLKPENIMVGKYGEVTILDWGLAKLLTEEDDESSDCFVDEDQVPSYQTLPGKVIGTVAYMAPERARGEDAHIHTEVYALGVILYQILTLELPFHRGNLKAFRKSIEKETLIPPIDKAPHREIPQVLSQIVQVCLSNDVQERYSSVPLLISDLERYMEGRSDWIEVGQLSLESAQDWEFQENVLVTRHIAITRGPESSDWVNLMISKHAFVGNTKLHTHIVVDEECYGIGFLLSVPSREDRRSPMDGYCLWLGTKKMADTKLLRSNVVVVSRPDVFLEANKEYELCIENIDNNIYFYINRELKFSYVCHLPLSGAHVGLLYKETGFVMKDLLVFEGSVNITLGCLAIPDAFLASKNYNKALIEYKRIVHSFPGRPEEREALFRSGIAFLEWACHSENAEEKDQRFNYALDAFEMMSSGTGAPLGYLGKSLVYYRMGDFEQEVNCLEIAFRRYRRHPLLSVLEEQLVYRMHETSQSNRVATYRFILLILRFIPHLIDNEENKRLFLQVKKHWEPLYFIQETPLIHHDKVFQNLQFSGLLAFWLAKPYHLEEIFHDLIKLPRPSTVLIGNLLYCLLELGAYELCGTCIEQVEAHAIVKSNSNFIRDLKLFKSILAERSLEEVWDEFEGKLIKILPHSDIRLLLYLMNQTLIRGVPELLDSMMEKINILDFASSWQLHFDALYIWSLLQRKQWDEAHSVFKNYSLAQISQDASPLHFLYGCFLAATEGKELALIHYAGVLKVSFPYSWALLSHYLTENILDKELWCQQLFSWKRRQLYRHAELFYHCLGDQKEKELYAKFAADELIL